MPTECGESVGLVAFLFKRTLDAIIFSGPVSAFGEFENLNVLLEPQKPAEIVETPRGVEENKVKLEELENQVKEYNELLAKTRQEKAALEEANKNLSQQNSELNAQLSHYIEFQSTIDYKEREVSAKQLEVNQLEIDINVLGSYENKLRSNKLFLENCILELNNKIKLLEAESKELESKVQDESGRLANEKKQLSAKNEAQQLKANNQNLLKHQNKLKADLDVLGNQILEIHKGVGLFKVESKVQEKQELQDEINKLEHEREQLKASTQSLEDNNLNNEEFIEACKTKKSLIQVDIEINKINIKKIELELAEIQKILELSITNRLLMIDNLEKELLTVENFELIQAIDFSST